MERSDVPKEPSILVSVIVPTFNRPGFLKSCLESLVEQSFAKDFFEVIVVDDGSPQEIEAIVGNVLADTPISWRYVRIEHRGPAGARNSGIQISQAPIVVFIDDDCVAEPTWLVEILRPFDTGSVDGVEGRVVRHNKSTPFTHFVENLGGRQFLTANIAYRRKALVDLGGFDEGYRHAVAEDWDLAFRILERGGRIVFHSRAMVVHSPVPMSGKDLVSRVKERRYSVRLYKRFPQLWKKTAGRSLKRSFFEGIFMGPVVETRKWGNYFRAHPYELPRYIFWQTLTSARLLVEFVRLSYRSRISYTKPA